MKVVLVNTVCGKSGSVGRITAELLNYAADKGIEAYAAYGRGEAFGIDEKRGIPMESMAQFYVDVFKSRLFDSAGFNSASATKKLIARLKEINPDVIHLHNAHGYYLNVPLFFNYIREKNIKLVWTLHDCWPFTGHCAYFSLAGCERWKTGCYSCPLKSQYPKAYIDRSRRNYKKKKKLFTSLNNDNVIIAVPSKWLKDNVKDSFLGDYSVEVVNNGVDVSSFIYDGEKAEKIKKAYAIRGEKIILGVTNVWDERKGLSDFFALAKSLPSYKFIGVGSAPSAMENMPENMAWIERTNNVNELAGFYSAADVFVNPTYDDNYPTTHMEAQCCGTAVISYDVGGCNENIISPYGKCVAKGDIAALKAAAEDIAENGYSKEKLSSLARPCFDKTASYANYLSLYQKILGRGGI